MEHALIVAGLALIAYGAVILRRPWDWYLINEVEPFGWLPGLLSMMNPEERAIRYVEQVQREFVRIEKAKLATKIEPCTLGTENDEIGHADTRWNTIYTGNGNIFL